MNLFDSHCHLDAAEFDLDRDAVFARARAAGVSRILVPGVCLSGIPAQLAFCRTSTDLHAAVGLHPVHLDTHRPGDTAGLRRLVADKRDDVVAIGEIGLDYFVESLDRSRQKALFEEQLALAREFGLPVILHVRRAHDAVLSALRKARLPRGGICHAFAGSPEQARQYIGLGFLLGFGGAATWDKARRLHRLLRELPLSSLLLETDAPDMPPAFLPPGSRNSPEYLPAIARGLAVIRGIPPEKLAEATFANASRVLGLPVGGS